MFVVWGSFLKPASLNGCLAVAEDALRAQNLQVLKGADGADYLVVGGNAAVTLTIVCVPRRATSGSSCPPHQATRISRPRLVT